jgi:Protein of unknown function (DUF4241)
VRSILIRRLIQFFLTLFVVAELQPATAQDTLAPPSYVKAFELAFTPGFTWPGDDKAPVPFEVIDGGTLIVTSGVIKATDPFLLAEDAGFTQKVFPGRYPVRFAHARVHGEAGGRIAFARVDFATKPVVYWQMAQTPGQDASTLKPGYIFGYPVDAGTGSFMDQAAAKAMLAKMADAKKAETITDQWINTGEVSGKAKGLQFYINEPVGPNNIIMFQSGWGDGFYASYFGFAADGTVVTLLTDFQVMDWSLATLPK